MTFKSEKWLNPLSSPSTGSVICYHGQSPWNKQKEKIAFVQINDCHNSVRLHKVDSDSKKDFANKIGVLIEELEQYRNYLLK